MDPTKFLEWVLQTVGGVLILVSCGLAGFALKEIYRMRSDFSALQAKVEAKDGETQRAFARIESWVRDIGEKIDTLIEKRHCDRKEPL